MKKIIKQTLFTLSGAVVLSEGGCSPARMAQSSNLETNFLISRGLLASLPRLDTARVSADVTPHVANQFVCGNTPMPTLLKELNQNDVYSSTISLYTNASLSAYGFAGNMGKKDVLISSYFIKFKDYPCGNNKTKKILVGIRLYVHATDLKVKVNSPSIGVIAAAAELGLAKSEYRLRTFGLNPSDFNLSLPSATFDVDSYSKVISAYDKIVHSLNDNTPIDPIVEEIQ